MQLESTVSISSVLSLGYVPARTVIPAIFVFFATSSAEAPVLRHRSVVEPLTQRVDLPGRTSHTGASEVLMTLS